MYYSYVMGIDDSINTLKKDGFIIEADGDNYMVSFPENKAVVWERYISKHLKLEFWNEYIAHNSVVFLFHLQDGIKRYEVNNYEDAQVLKLCENLCKCKFESIKAMLEGNHFYRDKLN